MRSLLLIPSLLLPLLAAAADGGAADDRPAAAAEARPRPVIFNNDGGDAYLFPANREFSIENFLKERTTQLPATSVSTVSYCTISSSFGQFTHPTRLGEFLTLSHNREGRRNITGELARLGTDPLREVIRYAHANSLEVFWCQRMNDCHDVTHRTDKPYERYSKLKQDHPDWLFGAIGEKLPNGVWSAVDYRVPQIRELAAGFVREVADNYEIDGVELDFCRHFHLFGTVARGQTATPEERAMIVAMIRQIRSDLDAAGRKRNRPILLAIRVPDSPEYCRDAGLDLETILREHLIDILIGGGYFQLNSWDRLAALGQKYGVKTYAGLAESRIQNTLPAMSRFRNAVWRGRAAAALQAGVDGIYIFNQFNLSPSRAAYAYELKEPAKLFAGNKFYFATSLDGNPGLYLKDGAGYRHTPLITPKNPLKSRNSAEVTIETGEISPPREVRLFCQGNLDGGSRVELNGVAAELEFRNGELSVYRVDPAALQTAQNRLAFHRDGELILKDIGLLAIRNPEDPELKTIFSEAKNEKK